jgi:hypothetical protein
MMQEFASIPRCRTERRKVFGINLQKGPAATPDGNRQDTPQMASPCSETGPLRPSGEAYSALRGWRPIPAALLTQFLLPVFPGRRPSLSLRGQTTPDKRKSIRDGMRNVKSNPGRPQCGLVCTEDPGAAGGCLGGKWKCGAMSGCQRATNCARLTSFWQGNRQRLATQTSRDM